MKQSNKSMQNTILMAHFAMLATVPLGRRYSFIQGGKSFFLVA
jgi:hypothetical protein